MKRKFIFLLIILLVSINVFSISVFSQEFYLGYRVVTWEDIAGLDFSIIRSNDDSVIISFENTGEIVVVRMEE